MNQTAVMNVSHANILRQFKHVNMDSLELEHVKTAAENKTQVKTAFMLLLHTATTNYIRTPFRQHVLGHYHTQV